MLVLVIGLAEINEAITDVSIIAVLFSDRSAGEANNSLAGTYECIKGVFVALYSSAIKIQERRLAGKRLKGIYCSQSGGKV